MKKVNCTVIYSYENKHYILHSINVKHKHENILLYSDNWDAIDKKHQYNYELFNILYSDVLAFLKSNNFYVHSWKMFDAIWYDIDFIDKNNWIIERYSLK